MFDNLIKKDKYQVFLCASPANFPFWFATHSWFVINNKGLVSRFGIGHNATMHANSPFINLPNREHWGYLYKNSMPLWQGIRMFSFSWKYLWKGRLLGMVEGDENSLAKEMVECIEHSGETYSFRDRYSLVGPNSNTYMQWVINKFPDSGLKLPWNAFGKSFVQDNR